MRKKEKIIKTHVSWKKASQVRKLKIVMTFVAVALCISVAAGVALAWVEIKRPFDHKENPLSQPLTVSSQKEELPIYQNDFNIVIVNSSIMIPSDFSVELEEYSGYSFDGRILTALKRMIEDANSDGCTLKICGGYVGVKEQDMLFQKEVQQLMQTQGFTQVRAENKVQSSVGRGGYNENQTGMAVTFCSSNAEQTDFSKTPEYNWLIKNSIAYGFVLRYPENKASITGMDFNPQHFRYVGVENATKMREYSMCLEEYAQYIYKQS